MIDLSFSISNILLYCSLVVRDQINKEYRKYKNVTNQAVIEEVYLFVLNVHIMCNENVMGFYTYIL